MSDEKNNGLANSLVVSIAGDQVKVMSDQGAEYIARMANYINHVIDEFNYKKGYGLNRNTLLSYAALELCDTLFRERDSKMTKEERKYEKMFQMEVFSHKRTSDQLESVGKLLKETERELIQARKEIDDLVKEYDEKASNR